MSTLRRLQYPFGLLAILCCTPLASAQAQTAPAPSPPVKVDKARIAASVPLADIPEIFRDKVRICLEKPTLFTPGQAETFVCKPDIYYWFLDHPDHAVLAWQRLGATVMPISDRGSGKFGWSDELGSDVVWQTAYKDATMRVWYAEGKVKPGKLMPFVPVKAVVVLYHADFMDGKGRTLLAHQAHLFIHADNAAMALAAKIFGAATPHIAEQSVAQMQMFFAGLAWYMEKHPDRAESLLK